MIRQIFIQLSHKLQSHTIHLEGHLIEFSIGEICIGSGIELEIDIGLYLSYLVSIIRSTMDGMESFWDIRV